MKKIESASFGVIGLGRFGTALAQSLAESGKEVIVIDCNEDKVRELRNFTEHAFVTENLTKETLEEIGIQNCDTVIICIGEKIDTSILTTLNGSWPRRPGATHGKGHSHIRSLPRAGRTSDGLRRDDSSEYRQAGR